MLTEKHSSQPAATHRGEQYHAGTFGALKQADAEVYKLITKEYDRLQNNLQLIAAENICSRAVLAAIGSVVQNKTAEGYPGGRLHGGCEVVDEIEKLAVDRAKQAFAARYVNVQPHSGTTANQIVLTAVLESGDKILSLALEHGGHFSHGSDFSFIHKFFEVENYYVDRKTYLLDYDAIKKQANKSKPKLIICGASAYTRTIDFRKFREIADAVGAYLLADISHISGLVVAGAHPSSVDYAHFTTTSTYKPGGPRGGLIVMGKDFNRRERKDRREEKKVDSCLRRNDISANSADSVVKDIALWELIEKATFPGAQGTPYLNHIAAKAVFFKEMLSQEYKARQFKIIENARKLASSLLDLGYDVLTGGTDNHMILVNISNCRAGLTGLVAQMCLEDCGIVTNKNTLPSDFGSGLRRDEYDNKDFNVTSGIRLGTPIVTKNGMGEKEMADIAQLLDMVLKKVKITSDTEYELDESFKNKIRERVKELCSRFPMR